MMRKIIIDLFAGGGGASMGIEVALGRSPDVAINHDPVAVAMHAVNHPQTAHHCQDIWAVKPETVLPGRDIGLIWASPDCKHFSKAKGGKPKERAIRDLAWVVVDWIEKRRPDVVCVENVEEFRTWGPLDNEGNPIPEFAGQTFDDWITRIRKAGYHVEWRESRACDYGAPTIRKRLCIVARRKDIGRVIWPAPTHGAPDSDGVKKGRLKPWRTAAEIIDWSLPCPSIFDDAPTIMAKHGLRAVRPLAANTGARVARGIKRYVLESARPFIVGVGGRMGQSPERPADAPWQTITAKADSCVVVPSIQRFNTGATGHGMDEPLATVTANSFIDRPGGAAPLGLLAPHLMTMRNAGKPFQGADEPTHTVTAGGAHLMAVAGALVQTGYGERAGQQPRALDPAAPLGTVVASGKHAAVAAYLAQHNAGPNNRALSGRPADEPVSTVTATGSQQGLVAAHLVSVAHGDSGGRREYPMDEPHHTVTVGGVQHGLVAGSIMRQFGTATGHAADRPLATVMAQGDGGKTGLIAGALVKYYGTGDGQTVDAEPLHTVTTKDRFGLVEAALAAPPFGPQHEARAREVADFLRAHGAWDDREFVTISLPCDGQARAAGEGGQARAGGQGGNAAPDGCAIFVLADIGMRMLTPRELFNAQGFPPGYAIDRDATGRVFSKSDQIGRAGNSVSPPWAAAHVRANAGHLAAFAEAAE